MSRILDSESCFGILQKMAAKYGFWEIRDKVFLEEVKKYTFGKSNFKTFCKNRKSEILPPFLSTLDTWMRSGFVENGIGRWRSKKIFLRSDLRSSLQILQIKPLVYSFVVSCVVLQKDDCFVALTVGWTPPRCEVPRCEVPSHISPAWTTNQYLPFGIVKIYPEISRIGGGSGIFLTSTKNGGNFSILRNRWNGFSEKPLKVLFWKTIFQNFLQNSNHSQFPAAFVYCQYIQQFYTTYSILHLFFFFFFFILISFLNTLKHNTP
jgi:hypothetical protein